jgi:hypothetical protein
MEGHFQCTAALLPKHLKDGHPPIGLAAPREWCGVASANPRATKTEPQIWGSKIDF